MDFPKDLLIQEYAMFLKQVLGLLPMPVKNRTKNPDLKSYKEWQYKMPSDELVEEWFRNKNFKTHGIGIMLGKVSHLVVVDDDMHNGNFRQEYLSPVRVKSGNRGYHLYFAYNNENFTVVHPEEKLEIRNNECFLVIPPTKHKDTGLEYIWEIDDFEDLNFLDRLQAAFLGIYPLPDTIRMKILKAMDGKAYINQTIQARIKKYLNVPEGDRRSELISFAGSMAKIPTFKEYDLRTAINEFNRTYKPPIEQEFIEQVVKAFYEFRANDGIIDDVLHKPKKANERLTELTELIELEKTAPVTGYKGLDEIITGFLPTHLYVLTGETNSGKTSLAVNFAVNVARQGKKVLYLPLETGIQIIKFFKAVELDKAFNEITEEDLQKDTLPIDTLMAEECQDVDKLLEIIKFYALQYDLIIVDHIGFLTNAIDNPTAAQAKIVRKVANATKSLRAAILIVAHPKKPTNTEKLRHLNMYDISGSASFSQDAQEVLVLLRQYKNGENSDEGYTDNARIYVDKKKVSSISKKTYCTVYIRENYPKILEELEYGIWSRKQDSETLDQIINN